MIAYIKKNNTVIIIETRVRNNQVEYRTCTERKQSGWKKGTQDEKMCIIGRAQRINGVIEFIGDEK